jgi:F-type H+-transporting ATPase subunit O
MKINPQLLGGMIVEIGDRYVDMSISSKLRVYSEMVQEANV